MKRMIAVIAALLILLLCAAQAENRFSCDVFSIDLLDGVERIDAQALAGYEAAVQRDYPDAGETLLIARDQSGDAIIYIARGTGSAPQSAAESAAGLLLGDASAAAEQTIGDRAIWGFACSVGDTRFDIYYMQKDENSIVIGVAGMDADAIAEMLSSVKL